eukprot:CAMPEP_0195524908 /NCGR_PEP_ID=MMETSP0794_2-20130614/25023_1 /TAXON_ID=515487 /ORGANISM="Stephanopyxis turris, Strain CCMP 815" /LENGTH=183 /DNA_ID=CAMNT_0040655233 /DNA_START=80 /DNA_END=628 /DNA_ORIENTATION=+
MSTKGSNVTLIVAGEIESAEMYGEENVFCEYSYVYGPDWKENGEKTSVVSQLSKKAREVCCRNFGRASTIVTWNLPIYGVFHATNVHGWPRMVIQVYSKDKNGQKVMKGYGTLLIPTFPGHKTTYVHLFKPKSSTILQALIARLSGAAPEFKKPESVAGTEKRDLTRCEASGILKVYIEVQTK